MRSVDQTSRTLRALAKALEDNATKTTERERESLTEAVYRTVMERDRTPADALFFERPGVKRGLARVEEMEARASERRPNAS